MDPTKQARGTQWCAIRPAEGRNSRGNVVHTMVLQESWHVLISQGWVRVRAWAWHDVCRMHCRCPSTRCMHTPRLQPPTTMVASTRWADQLPLRLCPPHRNGSNGLVGLCLASGGVWSPSATLHPPVARPAAQCRYHMACDAHIVLPPCPRLWWPSLAPLPRSPLLQRTRPYTTASLLCSKLSSKAETCPHSAHPARRLLHPPRRQRYSSGQGQGSARSLRSEKAALGKRDGE